MNFTASAKADAVALGARLRELRQRRGFKLADVAGPVGVTRACICQWESGRSSPRHAALKTVAEVLNTSVNYLLTGHEMDTDPARKPSQILSSAEVIRRAREEIAVALGVPISKVRVEIDSSASP